MPPSRGSSMRRCRRARSTARRTRGRPGDASTSRGPAIIGSTRYMALPSWPRELAGLAEATEGEEFDRLCRCAQKGEIGQHLSNDAGEFKSVSREPTGDDDVVVGRMTVEDEV